MKKIAFIVFSLFFLTIGVAFAGSQTDKNCGCGLGSLLFQDVNDGLISQVAAATTNGSFGNQTFGITTGTLGCEKFSTIAMKEKLNIFVADNMDSVAVDIASGQGETLEAIADLAEVSTESREALYTILQDNFNSIYPNADVTHSDVVQEVVNIIEQI